MTTLDLESVRALIPYCETRKQEGLLNAILEHGTISAAAKTIPVDVRNARAMMERIRLLAAQRGLSPEHDLNHPTAPGQVLKGASTYYDADGKVRGQWVKTREDEQARLQVLKEAVHELCQDVPRAVRILRPKVKKNHLLNVIPWGDPHFGMYSWAEEAGEDFDLDIAKRDLCAAADNLIDRAPQSERLVFINLGDFFHADNLEGKTARSGNILDMDTRLPKVYAVGVSAMRACLEAALAKFRRVEVVNVPGNHDHVLSMTLNALLANVYENEPRVVIHDRPTLRHYIDHGKVLIGAVHGHTTKDSDLPGIMATERPELWGQTRHRYWYRGHHHHDALQEFNGCKVEQFRTLAANDAYATGGGWLSGRDMKCITHHAEYGEVGRITCGIDMLR